jgi:hypothetical protein
MQTETLGEFRYVKLKNALGSRQGIGRELELFDAEAFPMHRAFAALVDLEPKETLGVGAVVNPMRDGDTVDPRFDNVSLS